MVNALHHQTGTTTEPQLNERGLKRHPKKLWSSIYLSSPQMFSSRVIKRPRIQEWVSWRVTEGDMFALLTIPWGPLEALNAPQHASVSSRLGRAEQLCFMAEGKTTMNMCNHVLVRQRDAEGRSESSGKVSYSSWHKHGGLLTQAKDSWHSGSWSICWRIWAVLSSAGEGNLSQPDLWVT